MIIFFRKAVMEETPLEAAPYIPKKRGRNKRILYLFALVLIILLVFLGFKIFSLNSTKNLAVSPNPSPTPSIEKPTNTPIPTPTVALVRGKLSVTVQNGSGEVGAASKVSDYLKSLGYAIVATGNADNFDYTNVLIK